MVQKFKVVIRVDLVKRLPPKQTITIENCKCLGRLRQLEPVSMSFDPMSGRSSLMSTSIRFVQ